MAHGFSGHQAYIGNKWEHADRKDEEMGILSTGKIIPGGKAEMIIPY
jgi:hypothetical protein